MRALDKMSGPLEALVGRPEATIADILEARVERTPDAPFLIWGTRRWTYAEGLREIQQFAGWASMASGQTDSFRIASFLPNYPETVWTWLGASHAGVVYIPLNYNHQGDILGDMLRRSGAKLLVTDVDGLDRLPPLASTPVTTVLVVGDHTATHLPAGIRLVSWAEVATATATPPASRSARDAAAIMYTSGTTGRSKAVVVPHNQLCRGASAVSHSLEISSHDVIHAWLPLYHVAGQLDSVLCTIIGGGAVALFSTFSRPQFWRQVSCCGATIFAGFSNVIEDLWAMPPSADDAMTALRVGMVGGIPSTIHRQFEERFNVRLCDVYGMTEAEPIALPAPRTVFPVGSCGRVNPDFEVAILDESDNPLPANEVGEIAARPRTPNVMFESYEDDEHATLDACRTLWLHTGDLGRFDNDGFLYFIDRRKHAIRRRGENISAWEVENILARHPAVAECCAVGISSAIGDEDVKIAIVPSGGETPIDPGELHEWCKNRMAHFMVPRYIDIINELPRNPAGKLLKDTLRVVDPSTWDAKQSVRPML